MTTCREPFSNEDGSWLETIWSRWECCCRRHGNIHKEEVKSRGSHGGKLIWAVLHKSAQHETSLYHIKASFWVYINHLGTFFFVGPTGETRFFNLKQMKRRIPGQMHWSWWKQVSCLFILFRCYSFSSLIDFLLASHWGWTFKRSDKHNSAEGDRTSGGAAPVPN